MPKRSIPSIPRSSMGSDRYQFDIAVKENVELITGQRNNQVEPLSSTASNADIIKKINEIVLLLQ